MKDWCGKHFYAHDRAWWCERKPGHKGLHGVPRLMVREPRPKKVKR